MDLFSPLQSILAQLPAFPAAHDLALPVAIAAFLLAGLVKGVVGLGLPTVSMALLALVMSPAQAAALLVLPSLVTNLWQLGPWSTLVPLLSRLAPMQVAVVAGSLFGSWLFGAPRGGLSQLALGLALIAYAGWGLAGRPIAISPAKQHWMGPLAGALTGLITSATGVFMLPAVPYLQGIGLDRDHLVQAMGLSFTVSTFALAAGLVSSGGWSGGSLPWSFLLLLPALLGMIAGAALRRRLSAERFRICLMLGLAALGLHLAARTLLS